MKARMYRITLFKRTLLSCGLLKWKCCAAPLADPCICSRYNTYVDSLHFVGSGSRTNDLLIA